MHQHQLQREIIRYLKRKPGKKYSAGTIKSKIKSKNSKDSVKSALQFLVDQRSIQQSHDGRYFLAPDQYQSKHSVQSHSVPLEGIVDLTASGGAYVIVKERDQDIFIPRKHVYGALQGDTVIVTTTKPRPGRRPEGRIQKIVQRKKKYFIGVFQDFNKYGYVFVNSGKMSFDIKILPADFNLAKSGDGVIVEVTDFGSPKRQEYKGRIDQIIPRAERNDFEMSSILVNNGFSVNFPKNVLKAVRDLEEQISQEEINTRKDLRDLLTFTIDPVNAKDFDDAISLQRTEEGLIEIGVHIADVTHYVQHGSSIDQEAFKRSTSVYLVDRVCPMLPEKLSNELCSLRPEEDKLTFSVLFYFNQDLKLTNYWIGKTVIRSNKRFTYEEAQEVLDEGRGPFEEELKIVNKIARILNRSRFAQGSINFESDEVRFELDERGNPIRVLKKERQDAHRLVEEFMLLANKQVSSFVSKKSGGLPVPFIYRVHDLPDNDKLADLSLLASEFGIKLNFDSPKQITHSLNLLSSEEIDEDIGSILRPIAIRCMSKAEYSADNIGHYGLGFDYYSHFTSPIRRYSDILAHRILEKNLSGIERVDKRELGAQCQHISIKERDAINAERESIKYKQVEYYSDKIGMKVEGIIRSLSDRGIFIELIESQADGFVAYEDMQEEIVHHPGRFKITGRYSGTIWQVGDRVDVIILYTDLEKRQIGLIISMNTLYDDH